MMEGFLTVQPFQKGVLIKKFKRKEEKDGKIRE
jgi:hypothetical protein